MRCRSRKTDAVVERMEMSRSRFTQCSVINGGAEFLFQFLFRQKLVVMVAVARPFISHLVKVANLSGPRRCVQVSPGEIAIDIISADALRDERFCLLRHIEALFGIRLPNLRHDSGLSGRKPSTNLAPIAP